jgi:hypothetical protein
MPASEDDDDDYQPWEARLGEGTGFPEILRLDALHLYHSLNYPKREEPQYSTFFLRNESLRRGVFTFFHFKDALGEPFFDVRVCPNQWASPGQVLEFRVIARAERELPFSRRCWLQAIGTLTSRFRFCVALTETPLLRSQVDWEIAHHEDIGRFMVLTRLPKSTLHNYHLDYTIAFIEPNRFGG